MSEWDELRAKHYDVLPARRDGIGIADAAFDVCAADDEVWPCSVSRLLDERDGLAKLERNRWSAAELLDIFDRTADRPAIRAKIRHLVDPSR